MYVEMGKTDKKDIFWYICSSCSEDEELWPEKSITSQRSHIRNGGLSCGCAKNVRWKPWQREILSERECLKRGYKFIGTRDGWNGSRTILKIECKKHGVFEKDWSNFFSHKGGCNECHLDRKRNTEDEILSLIRGGHKFIGFVGGKYINNRTKMILDCDKHGIWDSTDVHGYLSGNGCPKCGGKLKKTIHEILKNIHEDDEFIGFVGGEYINAYTKMILKCRHHGIWDTTSVHNYINGQNRCPGCSTPSFDKNNDSFIYIAKSICGKHMKIGITSNIEPRIRSLRHCTPFNIELILTIKINGMDARKTEWFILNKYEKSGFSGFSGSTEWMKFDKKIIEEVKALI